MGNFDPGRLWTRAGGKDSANTIADAGSLMLGHVTAMTLSGHRPTACLSIYVCSCAKQRSVWHVCTVTLFDPCLAMTFQSHRQVQPHVFPSKTSDGSPFGVSHPGNCTESSMATLGWSARFPRGAWQVIRQDVRHRQEGSSRFTNPCLRPWHFCKKKG